MHFSACLPGFCTNDILITYIQCRFGFIVDTLVGLVLKQVQTDSLLFLSGLALSQLVSIIGLCSLNIPVQFSSEVCVM